MSKELRGREMTQHQVNVLAEQWEQEHAGIPESVFDTGVWPEISSVSVVGPGGQKVFD